MNPDKRINQLLNGLAKFYERNAIDDIVITETEIEFRSEANATSILIGYSIFILLIFLPPILLAIYVESKWIEIIALIWIAIFSYQFIQIIRYENKVRIKISDQSVLIESEDPIGKFLFRKKRIEFNQIREFKTELHKITRYGSGYTGVVLITNEEEKQRLISFENNWVAEKTKNILMMIIQLMNKITEPNKVQ